MPSSLRENLVLQYQKLVIPVMSNLNLQNSILSESTLNNIKERDEDYIKHHALMAFQIRLAQKIAFAWKENPDDLYPWWTKPTGKPAEDATGVAAFKANKDGCFTYGNNKQTFIIMKNDDIGFEYGESNKSIDENKMIEDIILAQQQLYCLKRGKFSINKNGSQYYISKSLKIAIENGTWPGLANKEIDEKKDELILNRISEKYITKEISNLDINKNCSTYTYESILDNFIKNTISTIETDISKKRQKYRNDEKDVEYWIDQLKFYHRAYPGELIDKILKSEEQGINSFTNVIRSLMKLMEKHPEIKKSIKDFADYEIMNRNIVSEPERFDESALNTINLVPLASAIGAKPNIISISNLANNILPHLASEKEKTEFIKLLKPQEIWKNLHTIPYLIILKDGADKARKKDETIPEFRPITDVLKEIKHLNQHNLVKEFEIQETYGTKYIDETGQVWTWNQIDTAEGNTISYMKNQNDDRPAGIIIDKAFYVSSPRSKYSNEILNKFNDVFRNALIEKEQILSNQEQISNEDTERHGARVGKQHVRAK